MTTDITELALIAKIKKQLENFDTVVLKEGEAVALVEALERKEEQRANWFQMAQKLGEDLDSAEKRIAELESRTITVKLPESFKLAKSSSGLRYYNISNGYAMDRPENDTVNNMVPACIPCNLFKMCSTVEDFRKRIATQVDVTRRASRSYRTAESFGLVQPTNSPVVFWFEKYQGEAE